MSAEVFAAASDARRHRGVLGLAALGCVALQFPGTIPLSAAALLLWLGLLAALHRPVLRALWRPRFWGFTLLLALASGLLLGPRQPAGIWSYLSRPGLEAGLLMVLRGALIFGLASWASRAVSGQEIQRAAGRMGLPGLGAAMATALALLPGLSQALRHIGPTKGEGKLRRLRGSAVWLVTQTARLARDMAAGQTAGDSLAAHFGAHRPLLAAVLGEPGSGKTTRVTDLARRLEAQGSRVGGLVQPVQYKGEHRTGYHVLDLLSGQERLLASRLPDGRKEGGLGFRFDQESWEWAGQRLQDAMGHADILVLDEMGRLEARGEGHLPALRQALGREGPAAFLLAVRADQADAIQERLGPFDLVLTPDARDDEVEVFLARLLEGRQT